MRGRLYIYYLSQTHNRGLDTHDSCVVIAKSAADAKKIHPSGRENDSDELGSASTWAPPGLVKAERIGTAAPGQVRGFVCASFNAG